MSYIERSVINLIIVAILIFAIYYVYKAVLDARKEKELQEKNQENKDKNEK